MSTRSVPPANQDMTDGQARYVPSGKGWVWKKDKCYHGGVGRTSLMLESVHMEVLHFWGEGGKREGDES